MPEQIRWLDARLTLGGINKTLGRLNHKGRDTNVSGPRRNAFNESQKEPCYHDARKEDLHQLAKVIARFDRFSELPNQFNGQQAQEKVSRDGCKLSRNTVHRLPKTIRNLIDACCTFLRLRHFRNEYQDREKRDAHEG